MCRKYISRQSHAARGLHVDQPWPKTCHCGRTIIPHFNVSPEFASSVCAFALTHSSHTHTYTHTLAVVIIRRNPEFDLRSVRGGFLVDWTAAGQNFSRILRFPLASFHSTSSSYSDSFVYHRCCTVQLLTEGIWMYWCIRMYVCVTECASWHSEGWPLCHGKNEDNWHAVKKYRCQKWMDLRKGLLPAIKKSRFYFHNIQHKRVYLLGFLLVRQNTSHRFQASTAM